MSKNVARVAARIAEEMTRNGRDVRAAFDTVLGAGAYEKFAGELYDRLRAKAA